MGTATRTVEEVLREGGSTAFHRRIVAVTGFAWTFVAFEIILIGFVLPGPTGIFATFGVGQNAQPTLYFLVASATLIGSFIGSLVLGRLADARGRRTVFLLSAFLARVTVPESPFFYARQGRLDEAARVLSRISGSSVDPASLTREQSVPRAPVSALFTGRLTRRSIVTIIVWIALNFSYYG